MSGQFVYSKDGTKIYASATGDPSKPCIVFIHGLTLSGGAFDHLFENKRLTDEYFLVNLLKISYISSEYKSYRSDMISEVTEGVIYVKKIYITSL